MRAIVIVIDSFGIGALPDAADYGDTGANTAYHICSGVPEPAWPNLCKLGLGNASELLSTALSGCPAAEKPAADFGVMAEKSPGKDTTTGHWELAGIILDKPFRLFRPDYPSFPNDLADQFCKKIGRKILGNKSASGTEIITELGDEHMRTGCPICYTSADSVFQIAAEESVIPPEQLYEICEAARDVCNDFNVGRVIARPFEKNADGSFTRTSRRRDFSIELPGPTVMDKLQKIGVETIGIGKIGDIFNEQGLSESYHDKGNEACIERLVTSLSAQSDNNEFIFVNLVDTDMLYGHRRDIQGYHDCVADIDANLNRILPLLNDEDILIITADHGCDPGFKGTDHTREWVPFLKYSNHSKGQNLGLIDSFSYTADTILSFFS